jgi:ESS family glutamate:Na+ symporter
MDIEIDFDMSLKDPLMLAFFATIGLNANLASLRAGGKVLGTFLIVVVGLLLLQNALGIGMAKLLGLDPLMGLLAGSITFPAATAPGRRGASCSLSATVLPTPPRWRWPARLSAWCWAA